MPPCQLILDLGGDLMFTCKASYHPCLEDFRHAPLTRDATWLRARSADSPMCATGPYGTGFQPRSRGHALAATARSTQGPSAKQSALREPASLPASSATLRITGSILSFSHGNPQW